MIGGVAGVFGGVGGMMLDDFCVLRLDLCVFPDTVEVEGSMQYLPDEVARAVRCSLVPPPDSEGALLATTISLILNLLGVTLAIASLS